MKKEHTYTTHLQWTGNLGSGTNKYEAYSRDFTLAHDGKKIIEGSSDPSFRGDKHKHNPEELLLDAIASCHMLWYLHLCTVNNVVVLAYEDHATAIMQEEPDGSGQFLEATLKPTVTVAHADMIARANTLHDQANAKCFIARSVNFPIHHQAQTITHD